MSHPFGDLLRQYRARKGGLSQTRLAQLAGYDQAILVRMAQGKKDLTGPAGRDRVVRLVTVLHEEGVVTTLEEANALLIAAAMPPLFGGQPAEQALITALKADAKTATATLPVHNSNEPTETAPARRTDLPAPLTRFIGRAAELTEIRHLLGETRLLTLTGAGGCGKTRLALEVGTSLAGAGGAAPAYPDGVWLVELAPVGEAALVAQTVASALHLRAMSRPAQAVLADHLREKDMLLVFDNCEHLIGACAEVAVALLQMCPRLHILATSREPLNVPGEITWRVPSLAPEEGAQLFTARARAAAPEFAVTPSNAEFVAEICRRLDYMPLALELAAARVRVFSVEQIAARLDDTFRLLTGGSRTALPRQQTLRATIDWSYKLLTDEERALFCQLSVFSGGWTLEAVEAIHGPGAAGLLEQLANKSLVVVEAHPTGTRYTMLETIQRYAHEKLASAGEDAERHARRLHLAYYTSLSQTAESHFVGLPGDFIGWPGEKQWTDILTLEIENARAALRWAARSGDWQAVLAGARLFVFFLIELGYGDEVRQWVDAAILSNPQASDTARATGMLYTARALIFTGDMVGSVPWYRRASALAHQLGDELLSLDADLMLGYVTPDDAQATALLTQVIRRWRQAGREFLEDGPVASLGERLILQGDYQQGTELLEQCVASIRATGEKGRLAIPLWNLGKAHLGRADYARARAALEESVALFRESGHMRVEPLVDLGTAGVYTGDYVLAREALRESFACFYQYDNLERIAQVLVLAAGLAQALGDLAQAARLVSAAAAIRRDHHTHGIFERELFAEYDRRLPAVRAAMDPVDFDRAWAEGQKLTLKEAITEALSI